jgi:hypothetical protein
MANWIDYPGGTYSEWYNYVNTEHPVLLAIRLQPMLTTKHGKPNGRLALLGG